MYILLEVKCIFIRILVKYMYFKNIVGVQNLDILNRACTGVYKVMYDYWIKWLTNFTYMYYQVINNLWRKRYTGKSKNDTKGDLWACYIWEYCGTYLTIYSFNVKFLTSHFKTWFYSYFRGTENLHLAVLHPRKIAVYKVGGASLLKIHNFCSQNDKFYIFKKLLHLIYSYYTKKILFQSPQGLWNMADTFNLICHLSIIWKGQRSISVLVHLGVLKVNAVFYFLFNLIPACEHIYLCFVKLIISCSYIVYNQFSLFSLNRAGFPLCAVHGWYCEHFWAGEFLLLSVFTGCFITGSNKIHAKTRQLCDSLINMAAGVLQVWESFNLLYHNWQFFQNKITC